MPGTLIVCSTPIGNLGDASSRLVETLGSADVVFAEDTRRAQTLLSALGVSAPIVSFFVGNESSRVEEMSRRFGDGQKVVLISDAGTPAVSDPGLTAVRAARQSGAVVSVVPGPSAVTAVLAVSGMPADRFVFEGFLPRKGRAARLSELGRETRTMVLFVAPHRLVSELTDIASVLGEDRQLCIGREVTKKFEEIWWGTLAEAITEWSRREPRGEFTLVVAGGRSVDPDVGTALAFAATLMETGMGRAEAAKRAADLTGVGKNLIYGRIERQVISPPATDTPNRSPSP